MERYSSESRRRKLETSVRSNVSGIVVLVLVGAINFSLMYSAENIPMWGHVFYIVVMTVTLILIRSAIKNLIMDIVDYLRPIDE